MTGSLHTGRYTSELGHKVHFEEYDPDDTSGLQGKREEEPDESKKLNEKLRQLQEMLYAEHKM